MPIRSTFYHPDRLVIGVATGRLVLADLVEFARGIGEAKLAHYRKIVDVLDAHPGFTEAELTALAQYIRQYPVDGTRGAIAFVADRNRGELAKLFASIEIGGRPAQVFATIHDARKWLAENPAPRD
jgi:hypothetical protein